MNDLTGVVHEVNRQQCACLIKSRKEDFVCGPHRKVALDVIVRAGVKRGDRETIS